jgi:hypothetical protein
MRQPYNNSREASSSYHEDTPSENEPEDEIEFTFSGILNDKNLQMKLMCLLISFIIIGESINSMKNLSFFRSELTSTELSN